MQNQKPIEAAIAGWLDSLPLDADARGAAHDLVAMIASSIDRHLTPKVMVALAERGVTKDQAIEFLARRALEGIIEDRRREEATA